MHRCRPPPLTPGSASGSKVNLALCSVSLRTKALPRDANPGRATHAPNLDTRAQYPRVTGGAAPSPRNAAAMVAVGSHLVLHGGWCVCEPCVDGFHSVDGLSYCSCTSAACSAGGPCLYFQSWYINLGAPEQKLRQYQCKRSAGFVFVPAV